MVDGRYLGRGDTPNRRLTDGQVAQLHTVRSSRHATAEQLIEGEIRRDPVPGEHRQLSHLFLVAQPLASPPDLLTSLIGTRELSELVSQVGSLVRQVGEPNWQYLQTHNEPRAEGAGFRSYGMLGRRFLPELQNAHEYTLLDVEVHDNGQVTLFCGRASDVTNDTQYVTDALVVTLARCAVTLAGQLGARAGYAGRWLLAVGVDDLHGKSSSSAISVFGRSYPPFSADRYIQGTEAVTRELLERPGQVTRRLLSRLLRALGTDTGERDALLTDVTGT
jgi:hypothetical protein